jgi:hypothetical protein
MPLSTEKKRLRPLVFRTSGQVVVAGPASSARLGPITDCVEAHSFDHLVGGHEQRWWRGQPKRLGGF